MAEREQVQWLDGQANVSDTVEKFSQRYTSEKNSGKVNGTKCTVVDGATIISQTTNAFLTILSTRMYGTGRMGKSTSGQATRDEGSHHQSSPLHDRRSCSGDC